MPLNELAHFLSAVTAGTKLIEGVKQTYQMLPIDRICWEAENVYHRKWPNELNHAGPKILNREAEMDRLSRVGRSGLRT